MAHKALIVQGGWDGHEPKQVAAIIEEFLRAKGFETEVSDTLDAFMNGEKLKTLDLIVPVWTMGKITGEQLKPLVEAVKSGVGIGGCHGGMCDSFREATEWQFMTGGQWVSHPGNAGVTYTVHITDPDHFITAGTADFSVTSEQYYLHTDPSNTVLATMTFTGEHDKWLAGTVMPVSWTRRYGQGRVAYCALGHVNSDSRSGRPAS